MWNIFNKNNYIFLGHQEILAASRFHFWCGGGVGGAKRVRFSKPFSVVLQSLLHSVYILLLCNCVSHGSFLSVAIWTKPNINQCFDGLFNVDTCFFYGLFLSDEP